MTKTDIAKRVQERVGISEQDAEHLLERILNLLKSTLQSGKEIAITGFGKFRVRSKDARNVRIPRTGEEMLIPARRVVTFHASSLLKNYIAGTKQSSTEGMCQRQEPPA
jgi:integration host factor subunit alpha